MVKKRWKEREKGREGEKEGEREIERNKQIISHRISSPKNFDESQKPEVLETVEFATRYKRLQFSSVQAPDFFLKFFRTS